MAALEKEFEGVESIPRPENWGAFEVTPHAIEFWQGRSMRFHDRIRYRKTDDGNWLIERLQP
jgi:pyridoxamine 5'-phosphate oxidase